MSQYERIAAARPDFPLSGVLLETVAEYRTSRLIGSESGNRCSPDGVALAAFAKKQDT